MRHRERGAVLAIGLILLTVVALLGLAGASTAHIERQLALNEQFRENAASAASAGIEYAIRRIVTSSHPDAVPLTGGAMLAGSTDRFEIVTRLVGYESALPQRGGANLIGAHFEILSTGHSARRAIDRQRAGVMHVVEATHAAPAAECAPAIPGVQCRESGELVRLSWQRVPAR